MKLARNLCRWLALAPLCALLAACANIPHKSDSSNKQARLLAYAGAPIDHFTWLGRYDGWTAVSANQALLWTSPDKAYLITVQEPCGDLRFAMRIGLTSTLHTVYSNGLDAVRVRGWRCPIKKIQPVDYARYRQDLKIERQQARADAAVSKSG